MKVAHSEVLCYMEYDSEKGYSTVVKDIPFILIFSLLKTGLDYKRLHELYLAHFLSDHHTVKISAMQI